MVNAWHGIPMLPEDVSIIERNGGILDAQQNAVESAWWWLLIHRIVMGAVQSGGGRSQLLGRTARHVRDRSVSSGCMIKCMSIVQSFSRTIVCIVWFTFHHQLVKDVRIHPEVGPSFRVVPADLVICAKLRTDVGTRHEFTPTITC